MAIRLSEHHPKKWGIKKSDRKEIIHAFFNILGDFELFKFSKSFPVPEKKRCRDWAGTAFDSKGNLCVKTGNCYHPTSERETQNRNKSNSQCFSSQKLLVVSGRGWLELMAPLHHLMAKETDRHWEVTWFPWLWKDRALATFQVPWESLLDAFSTVDIFVYIHIFFSYEVLLHFTKVCRFEQLSHALSRLNRQAFLAVWPFSLCSKQVKVWKDWTLILVTTTTKKFKKSTHSSIIIFPTSQCKKVRSPVTLRWSPG